MNLNFSIEQKQTVNQKFIHMVNLLQMNRQELLVYLEEQSMDNPLLEVDESIYQYMPSDIQEDWMEQLEDKKESLSEVLRQQLILEDYTALEETVTKDIIYSLDENGFLGDDISEIAKRNQVNSNLVKHCLEKIQSLEPAGIGAVDLKDCLMIQLNRLPKRNLLAENIVENYLELVAKNHLPRIARETKTSVARVKNACEIIKSLNPKPVNGCYKEENIKYILPDFLVKQTDGNLKIEFADHTENLVKIHKLYFQTEEIPQDAKSYIYTKTRQAEEVIRTIQNRKVTLQNIMTEIVACQSEFFFEGQKKLKTLKMHEIAHRLKIHESTVSRAVNGKYFQYEWGVFPVKYLFAKAISGNLSTTEIVKDQIKQLIHQEDKKNPLSDQKLQELLTQDGHKISRRTVAKYRMQMNIRDASGRKIKF